MSDSNVNYINHEKGLKSWLTTVDHKRIGLMYLWASVAALLAGGSFALMIRLQLIKPNNDLLDADFYNQCFTLHGIIMVFLFIIPAVPAALGNFVLPIMLGAKDVAFPRMNLASLYIYVLGAIIAMAAIVLPYFVEGWTPLTTGWTFYTPYSKGGGSAAPVIIMTLAAFVLGFSSIFTGLNFIVTVHKLRAKGMGWYKMPLMVWALYATSILQVLATPVLGVTLMLLAMENIFDIGIFDPAKGGDPVLFQHFFWFYSHPAVYIMILPGMGVISEIISTFSKKVIFGYKAIANSSLAIAVISFFVWGHHMFLSGQTTYTAMIFSFLTFGVAIPSAIKVFNWTATLYRGSIDLKTPMVYALSFLFLFTIGGLTGLYLGTLSTDVLLHDTYFVVAHFHYVMFGGSAIAFFGGLHFWWPKMYGVMYNETIGRLAAGIIFIGFNLTFFTQFFMGVNGFPRRYHTYGEGFEGAAVWKSMSAFSTYGAIILGVGIALMLVNLLISLKTGAKAPRNPWGASTLEWETQSPPVFENFEGDAPELHQDPYTYS